MNKRYKAKILIILAFSFCASFFFAGNALADGGVAITGSFSTYIYKIVQGETIDTPQVNAVFVNNSDKRITLNLSYKTPEGVTILLADTVISVDPHNSRNVPIVIKTDMNAVPGEYDITFSGELQTDAIVNPLYTLTTQLTVFGEAADIDIDIVDVKGDPIKAVMNLYHIIDGSKSPLAFSTNGKLVERIVPGDYEIIAFWNDIQIASKQFSVVSEEKLKETIVAQTLQIYNYAVLPVYMQTNENEVVTVNIAFELNNIYQELENVRIVLGAYINDELLEEKTMYNISNLEIGRQDFSFHYTPAQGWNRSKYKFVIDVYSDDINENDDVTSSTLYATSQPQYVDVSNGISLAAIKNFFTPKVLFFLGLILALIGIVVLAKKILSKSGARAGASVATEAATIKTIAPRPKVAKTTGKPKIGGASSRHCPDCAGRGTILCPVCEGKGTTLYSGIAEECIYCNGIGEVICSRCISKKYTNVCLKCNGDGSILEHSKAQNL